MSSRVALPGFTPVHLHDTMARLLYSHTVEHVLLLCVTEELQGHLAGAQKDMEEVLQHNLELQRANANMGDQVRQAQLEHLDLMARFEAQSAELTSVKVGTSFYLSMTCRQAVQFLSPEISSPHPCVYLS